MSQTEFSEENSLDVIEEIFRNTYFRLDSKNKRYNDLLKSKNEKELLLDSLVSELNNLMNIKV